MRHYPRFRPRGAMRGHHAARSGLLSPRSRRSREANEVGPILYTSRNGPQLWYRPNSRPRRLRPKSDERASLRFQTGRQGHRIACTEPTTVDLAHISHLPLAQIPRRLPHPLPWRAIRHRRKYVSNAHPVRESWWGVFSGDARPSPRRPPENYFDCFYFIIKRPVCRVWPSELISRMSKPPKCTSVYCNGRREVGA